MSDRQLLLEDRQACEDCGAPQIAAWHPQGKTLCGPCSLLRDILPYIEELESALDTILDATTTALEALGGEFERHPYRPRAAGWLKNAMPEQRRRMDESGWRKGFDREPRKVQL